MQEDLTARFVQARKTIIGQAFSSLNERQREAVLATEGPLLVLAGAGSGKTTVLIQRVLNILRFGRASDSEDVPFAVTEEQLERLETAAAGNAPLDGETASLCALQPAQPWQILAITFTNKAAGELKSRLSAALGEDSAADLWAMTFHSCCARILRRDADRLGFPKNFTIYDQSDSLSVMKHVVKDLELDEKTFPPRMLLNAAAEHKGRLRSAEENYRDAEKSGDLRKINMARACREYARRLRESDAMDFEDLLFFCVVLLRDYEEVREYYRRKFRYVLIDEYQDTNYLQYLMARYLTGEQRNICVVGDDDQSIYRFRGATIENILNFEKHYPNARVIRLEQNYRSTGNILNAANAVISHNTERKGKTLWTKSSAGRPVTLFTCLNEDEEAEFVCKTIRQSKRPANDFAVLYRTNAQSRALESCFKRNRINYKIVGGLRFYDRAEVKDVLSYLSVVANPTDETRLLRIVNNPSRGIGDTSLAKARELAARQHKSLFEILRSASAYPELSRASKKMEAFAAFVEQEQELLTELDLDEFYDRLLDDSGYLVPLEQKKGFEEQAKIENIRELKSFILKSMEESGGDLYSFLDEAALYSDTDSLDENEEAVVMMTMHAAKGLEFPVVFLVGAEEGLFPGIQSIGDEAAMQEERRLCYVAITRARETLYISSARMRMIYGRTNANLPSRFLEEIPDEFTEKRESDSLRRSKAYASEQSHHVTRSITPPLHSAFRTPSAVPAADPASFTVGDRVEHEVFGAGVIEKLTPMGGDALAEIRFESEGLKKLMLRIAAQRMKKL